jgi:hypothetical protein
MMPPKELKGDSNNVEDPVSLNGVVRAHLAMRVFKREWSRSARLDWMPECWFDCFTAPVLPQTVFKLLMVVYPESAAVDLRNKQDRGIIPNSVLIHCESV